MIKIGTRPSKLAVAQTRLFLKELENFHPDKNFEIKEIKTTGDNKQSETNVLRDKKDWIVELEQALISGSIDLAVHSAKDIPYDIAEQTIVLSVQKRALPNDVFIGKIKNGRRIKIADLQPSDRVGTASLRRQSQLLLLDKGIRVSELRGNVNTRISKLDDADLYEGIILAAAGLQRLGMDLNHFEIIPQELMLPAACQGILAVQIHKDRLDIINLLAELTDSQTQAQFLAERSFIKNLQADCHSSVSCLSEIKNDQLEICAKVFGQKSLKTIAANISTKPELAEHAGKELAKSMIELGAKDLLLER